MHRSFTHLPSYLVVSWLLCSCSAPVLVAEKLKNIPNPAALLLHQVDVIQGNFVSKEQVAALRVGMPLAQVKNILGTPLLTDIFHQDRWDYVFTIAVRGQLSEPRKLAVFFKNDLLERWEGDEMPSENEFVQSLTSGRKIGKTPALEATERQLNEFAKRNNAATLTPISTLQAPEAAASSTPAPSSKSYPPLESP